MLAKVEARGNVATAAQLLEQAAKEVGDVFVNRQRADDKGAGETPQPAQVVIGVVDARRYEQPSTDA